MAACAARTTPNPTLIAIEPFPTFTTAPSIVDTISPSPIPGPSLTPKSSGGSPGTVERPGYNTGTGFFVVNGKLYDAEGVEFRIRGVNKTHYDVEWPGIPKARANTLRWVTPLWLTPDVIAQLTRSMIAEGIVPMPGVWYTEGTWDEANNVVCKEDLAYLRAAVDLWVAQAGTFKPFERYILVNIASEWGPGDSPVWRDAYIQAVADLRAAGYLGTLVIDAGGCGQDPANIVRYGQEVFDSDPQRNIVFDAHVYGMWSIRGGEPWQTDLTGGLDSLARTGLPILIGEFGPGRNIGPSPTLITPGEIITACEARGFGWLAWAWDDPAYDVPDDWFAMSFTGDYNSSADLTTFGKEVVENPAYGLLQLARPATSLVISP
jgi:mannan endo-1,4-beta-mannosidase